MEYKDFWIQVMQDNTILARSHEGEQTENFTIEFDYILLAMELINERKTTNTLLSKVGDLLFNAILPNRINGLFYASLASARAEGSGLRVRITIQNDALSKLPWEYMHDPNNKYFLCLSPEIIISRYVNVQQPINSLRVNLPLKILTIISSPSDLPTLNVAKEVSNMRNAFRDISDLVEISVSPIATLSNIRQEIRKGNFHILHFIGHGVYNTNMKKGFLAFVDDAGLSRLVDEEILASFFVGNNTLRIIILNACETAKSDSQKVFTGIAPRLISQGALAVVAMQHTIADKSALIFSHDFYASIATGLPVDVATQEARKAILQEIGQDKRDFGTPVLYMRAPSGHLLDINPSLSPTTFSSEELSEEDRGSTSFPVQPIYCKGVSVIPERTQKMYDFGYIFLRLDQILQTGAWGHSLLGCMRKVSDRDLGQGWDLMRAEGGLITTATCLMGLASQWENKELFAFQTFVKAVVDFYSIRQDDNGGFGSLSERREKLKEYQIIKTQPRHTALAVMSLVVVEENHYAIVRGLQYLLEATPADYKSDYSTSMAMAFTISAFEKCRRSSWFYDNLTKDQKEKIFGEWNSRRVSLVQKLSDSDKEYFPFWKPYSNFSRFAYESFLLIVDVFVEDIPELLRHRIQEGLVTLLNQANKYGGLPFYSELSFADIGMTGFLLNCLAKGKEREQFSHPEMIKIISDLCPRMYEFIINSFDKFDEMNIDSSPMGYTYSAPMAKLIELPLCASEIQEKLVHISKLEQIISEISFNYTEKNLLFGEFFTEWFAPYCNVEALKSFLKYKLLYEK